jgi:hypothetical protein
MSEAHSRLENATRDAEGLDALWPRARTLDPQERVIAQQMVQDLSEALQEFIANPSEEVSDTDEAMARLALMARAVRAHMELALRVVRALRATLDAGGDVGDPQPALN